MKRTFFLCVMLVSSMISFAFSGSGTSSDPYQIRTADDLYNIRSSLGSYYKLMNDIDLSQWIADNYPEAGWSPIGSSASPFTGTLDGNGYTISNLNINRTTDYNGIIGYATGATVKNLHVSCDIVGAYTTAAIIGFGTSITVTDCFVEGNIDCTGSNIGGIIGNGNTHTLIRCAFEGSIKGQSSVGGLIGYLGQNGTTRSSNTKVYYTKINQCYAKGNVTASGSNVGGLIGYDYSAYAYNYASPYAYNTSQINDCYFDGEVMSTSGSNIGGISGYASGEYQHCLAIGKISGKDYVAGIAGKVCGQYSCYNGYSNYTTTVNSIIYSCVSLCSSIKSEETYVSRLCNVDKYYTLGTFGSNTENKVISSCQVYVGDALQNISDSQTQGYAIVGSALMREATYTAINWDFQSVWGIKEGESYPYLRFRQPAESTIKEVEAHFDFTKPEELSPAVTPNEEEDAGVNITSKTFSNAGISVEFGLGTRTQTYSARLWTNDNGTYSLRLYQNGTMTISAVKNDLITKIVLAGDDVSKITSNIGTISTGVWSGEANSVTFTIGATNNKINTIEVYYKHDGLSLTDTQPAVMQGEYGVGKIEYSRVTSGDYASFCLPYDINLAQVSGVEKVFIPLDQMIYNTQTGWLMMFLKEQEMTSVLTAGTPFLAKINAGEVVMSNSKSVTYKTDIDSNPDVKQIAVYNFNGDSGVLYENTDVNVTWGGTYVPTEAVEGMNSFNINGTFGQHSGTLNPFRAYVMQTSNSSLSKINGISVNLDNNDEATAIVQLLNEQNTSATIYNLNGQKVTTMQRGHIYIINGKKVLK